MDPAKAQAILAQQEAVSGRIPYPQGGFTAQEKTQGGYVMANLGGDRWRGNVGVRFVHTDQITTGAVFVADPNSAGRHCEPVRRLHSDRGRADLQRCSAFVESGL